LSDLPPNAKIESIPDVAKIIAKAEGDTYSAGMNGALNVGYIYQDAFAEVLKLIAEGALTFSQCKEAAARILESSKKSH
jgi:hypothetical protein